MRRLWFIVSVAVLALGLPRAALADAPSVQIVSPVPGSHLRGAVEVEAQAPPDAVSVAFDRFSDGGTTSLCGPTPSWAALMACPLAEG